MTDRFSGNAYHDALIPALRIIYNDVRTYYDSIETNNLEILVGVAAAAGLIWMANSWFKGLREYDTETDKILRGD